eukprot:TRINITY_DN28712_c0_g2_i1.p1 TRINITY_DN28712_c0_g2~~TRINITY_DN28712_c0_g2_i1.p1  ORF type:complete len:345 (-),score=75.04 TRINITY_DN28712_c0_g2_i1:313-1347(-)
MFYSSVYLLCLFKSNAPSAVEPSPENLSELQPSASEPCDFVGGILSCPKKSKLKVGKSSAFFTYVKSSMPTSGSPRFASADENVAFSKQLISELELPVSCKPVGNVEKQDETWESCSHCSHDNVLEVGASGRSSSVSIPLEYQGWNLSREQIFSLQVHSNTEGHAEVAGIPSLSPLPFCLPGMPNQIMMPPSGRLFQGNLHDVPKHATSATLLQHNTLPPCPHIPMITPLHYYPVGVGMQPGQMPVPHMWPSLVSSSSSPEVKSGRVERREAALIKFRQKRKDRCFEKKIRYVNRKRLAEKRPRVRGQFVRQMNDFNVDLNGHPIAVDDSDEDEQEEEDDEEDV